MGIRKKRIAVIATVLVVIGLGLPGIYAHWLRTREAVGLDMPLLSAALIYGGTSLLIFLIARHLTNPKERNLSDIRDAGAHAGQSDRLHRRLPLARRFSLLPSFGLVYSTILAALLPLGFVIYMCAWGLDRPSTGILVRLIKPGSLRYPEFRPPDLLLRIRCTTHETAPRFFLDSRLVEPETLPDALKLELKPRDRWVTYVEGDSSCSWQDIATAIDIVRTNGAQVVLSTTNVPLSDTAPSPINQSLRRKRLQPNHAER